MRPYATGSRFFVGVVLAATVAIAPAASQEPVRVTFLHVLSDFTGPLPFSEPSVAVDPESEEVLVGYQRGVYAFNEVGMEVFRFRTDRALATVLDLAVESEGRVVTLARDLDAPGDQPRVVATRYDFRGDLMGRIEITGAPPPYDAMLPNRVFSRGEKLVFANTNDMRALRTTSDGQFEQGYDLARLIEVPDDDRDSFELNGLTLDDRGNLVFTCAVRFRAYVVSTEGELVDEFGKSGSAPGTFGVTGGIARDRQGRFFVADKARRVVIVFDREHRLLTEVGGDPAKGPRLGRPSGVEVDGAGRLFVTQVGQQGVWVYRVDPN